MTTYSSSSWWLVEGEVLARFSRFKYSPQAASWTYFCGVTLVFATPSLELSDYYINLGKTHNVFFLVSDHLEGGGGKTPLNTKQKTLFFYDLKEIPEPHEHMKNE